MTAVHAKFLPEVLMRRSALLLCGCLLFTLALHAQQSSGLTPNEADFVLRDFHFESGETGYKTVKARVFGFVHHAHATAAQLFDDAIVRNVL